MSISGIKRPIRPMHGKNRDNHERVLDRTHDILNGGIDYGGMSKGSFNPSQAGNKTISGNTNSVHLVAAFAVTDVDVTITHNLNRIPTGYRLVSADNPVQIYNGSVAPTLTQITLRGHLVGAAANVILEIY